MLTPIVLAVADATAQNGALTPAGPAVEHGSDDDRYLRGDSEGT